MWTATDWIVHLAVFFICGPFVLFVALWLVSLFGAAWRGK
jgi:hypothetical protein